jgi:hypothetical protein
MGDSHYDGSLCAAVRKLRASFTLAGIVQKFTLMKTVRLFTALMLASFMAHAAEPAEPLPPLFYVIGLGSEVASLYSLGLTPGPAGDADRKATLLHSIACMGGECRRIVDPPLAWDNDWLTRLLAQEPTQAGRLAFIRVSFDGYYFDVGADLMEVKLDGAGRRVNGTMLSVIYNGVCPRPQRAEEIAALRSEMPEMSGVPNSYQSKMLEWSGCTNERLLQALGQSFARIAAFWQAHLTPGSGVIEKLANRHKLPLVRDVVAKDAVPCKTDYGDYMVVKDLGDYFWLAFPDDKIQGVNNILMVPRCGLA